MNSWFFLSIPFAFFVVLINISLTSSSSDWYRTCSTKFNCGGITEVGFPFWGDVRPEGCGYPELKLTCSENVTTVEIIGVKYRVLSLGQDDQTLKILRDDYFNKICSPKFGDTKLNTDLFDYVSGSMDFTMLYGCTYSSQAEDFKCPNGETYEEVAAVPGAVAAVPGAVAAVPGAVPAMCELGLVVRINVGTGLQVLNRQNVTGLEEAVREGFEVKYKVDSAKCGECVASKGVCGYDWNLNETVCYCRNQTSESRACSAIQEAIDNTVVPPAKGMTAATLARAELLSSPIEYKTPKGDDI